MACVVPCPPHPCLQRIELQLPGAVEARPAWSVACVFRSTTTVRCWCCMPPPSLGNSGQYCGTLQGPTCSAVDHTQQEQEQPHSVWFCFPSSPSPPPSGRRETCRDCLYSRFSLLPSPVPSRSRCCSPPSSPLSCLSCPCVAQHRTFLRASVGVLTVPGFPFSSPLFLDSSPSLFATRLDDDDWPSLATSRAAQSTKPKRIEPPSLLDCETLPHPPGFLSPPRSLVTPVPRPVAAHRNRPLEPLPSSLEACTHA